MFSSRFHWDLRPNRIARAIEAKRHAAIPLLDLTQSNPTHAGFDYPPDLLRALDDPRALIYDPTPTGALPAREAVSAYYAGRGSDVAPDRILLTASTSEAYAYLFKLLCNPGDSVLVPRPSYPLFEFLADMESVHAVPYPLVYHGRWSIDLDALGAAISDGTRAIVVVNPNNPTGSYLKREELAAMAKLCDTHGLALISDEVFADFHRTHDPARVSTLVSLEDCLTFGMSGLSKIAGLPQMKLGWIVVAGPSALRREAMEKLEWIADTYLSVSTPVQCAAPALLAAGEALQRQIRERCARNFQYVRDVLAGSAASLLDLEGGWYVTVQVPRIRTEEEWVLALIEHEQVLVQPGFFYDFATEAFLVVSLLTEEALFREGIGRIARLASKGFSVKSVV